MGVLDKGYPAALVASRDEGEPTDSSELQTDTEELVTHCYQAVAHDPSLLTRHVVPLQRERHVQFLLRALEVPLGAGFASLDASRPWIVFWACHGLDLLGFRFSDALVRRVSQTLLACQAPTGGFAGGVGQLAHVATTYAAVHALVLVRSAEGLALVRRRALLQWLLSLKQPDGSFQMHEGGEIDVRGSYCALAAATLLGVATPELKRGCGAFLRRCQTYEGGLGCVPFAEAHGGYTFCGLAAAELLGGAAEWLDLPAVLRWTVFRQMAVEGGFQGRTNKLVDACYAFWQGAVAAILAMRLAPSGRPLFDVRSLQQFVLFVAQADPLGGDSSGGLRDKPGARPDFYHTCYALSGLSVSQHEFSLGAAGVSAQPLSELVGEFSTVRVPATHPVFNIRPEHVSWVLCFDWGSVDAHQ